MKRKTLLKILGLLLAFVLAGLVFVSVGYVRAQKESRYPVMRPDVETLIKWQNDYLTAPKAEVDREINFMLNRAQALNVGTSMDLLDHIDYDPGQRNQGGCGNCWVWAGTGVMEIAHDVEDAVFDRLSIQYLDSCRAGWACCGGNLGGFATWYSGQGLSVPWDNTNAAFADGWRSCADGGPSTVTCASISTTPNYPLTTISDQSIETHTGQATAISNIKNILNQNRGVYFAFWLPDNAAWGDFFDFWNGVGGETEATLWPDTDTYCGDEWVDGEGAGHAVVIIGYNDDDADPANHYWITLNSWGTPASGGRPNGLFRIPTQMDYDCFHHDTETNQNFWAYQFQTLDVDFGNALPIADANGPYNVDCEGTTTTVDLDGSGSSDLEGPLSFSWSTTCPGGSFDDATSDTPVLTVNTSPGCSVACSVSLIVTDDDGATDTDAASVTIGDTDAPVITGSADVTIECDESAAPSNTGTATATDNCDPAPAISYSDAETPGTCAEEKTISRTWTATDACGNSSSYVQTINVVDTTPPAMTGPADVTIECDESTDPSNTGTATAADNCDPAPAITYADVVTPGTCPNEWTITRTWTATDACGNSSSGVQTIEVVDTTPPVISLPADVTIECDESTDPSNTGTATATDNCDPAPAIAYADVVTPGSCPNEWTITRTWTATDACGNSSSGVQTIEVVDTTAPVISCNTPATITPPDAPISFTATATDNCDEDPSVEITGFDCFFLTKKGKKIDKKQSCVVDVVGDTITILNTGGVGDHITWTTRATDSCENVHEDGCEVEVVKKGKP